MSEINKQKESDGYIYTIKSLEEKAIIECPRDCCYVKNYKEYECNKFKGITELPNSLCTYQCIRIVVNVKNIGNNSDWFVGPDDIKLVDNEGYMHEGTILCENCLPYRAVKNGTRFLPKTQVDYIQIFPCLPDGTTISHLLVDIHHNVVEFKISESSNDLEKIIVSQDDKEYSDITHITTTNEQWDIDNISSKIRNLKTEIFSRLNNVLTSTERTKLENKISNSFYSIQMELESRKSKSFKVFIDELFVIQADYKRKLTEQTDKENKRKSISKKIDELMELSPREFEEYVGSLFKHLGYDVEVTQYVNDKGIDIIMYKDNVKYGVQCKRYKGTVGSPEIQTFIGALNHAKADKGYFVTTGMFTFEAEQMAAEHPIRLFNRIELSTLVLDAISSHS